MSHTTRGKTVSKIRRGYRVNTRCRAADSFAKVKNGFKLKLFESFRKKCFPKDKKLKISFMVFEY